MSFDIDIAALDREYREIMTRLHPDSMGPPLSHQQISKGQTGVEKERERDAERETRNLLVAMLQRSYNDLKDPQSRANLLLKRRWENPGLEEETEIEDPQFLESMFEANEEMDELAARAEAEAGASGAECETRASAVLERLREVKEEWSDEYDLALAKVAARFKFLETKERQGEQMPESVREEAVEAIVANLQKLRIVSKVVERAQDIISILEEHVCFN